MDALVTTCKIVAIPSAATQVITRQSVVHDDVVAGMQGLSSMLYRALLLLRIQRIQWLVVYATCHDARIIHIPSDQHPHMD
jgi:hypothetical protein